MDIRARLNSLLDQKLGEFGESVRNSAPGVSFHSPSASSPGSDVSIDESSVLSSYAFSVDESALDEEIPALEQFGDHMSSDFDAQLASLQAHLAKIKTDVERADKKSKTPSKPSTPSRPPMGRRRRSRSRSPAPRFDEHHIRNLEATVRQLRSQLDVERETGRELRRDRDRVAAMLKARQNARQPTKEALRKAKAEVKRLKTSLTELTRLAQEQRGLIDMLSHK
ncbi:hypothetical protein J8273_4665 [Carpediemonas membranifera]|uniref:Uncharacterized protein n=1 Tax=Carpediemonas membranifera TaxID=201153 RepID=A0A8J6E3Z0_9EUKA|nr:hypothetical protein J8273_4665 [Carpediemonas membranifera]|eukprot:KAG9393802.1 hypothetical protein J8273_4665 [Carpediemonas membranifera]